MNVLITGASGFTGYFLIKHLLSTCEAGLHIWGISRSAPQISHSGFTFIRTDLSRENEINATIRQVSPDAVIHLAGLNQGTLSELISTNVINTENLLKAVRKERPDARVLVVGSSAEYGYAGEIPITEETPLRPVGLYGISKVAEDLLAVYYYTAYNLGVTIARPFNLIGPGQSDTFICGKLTRQAAEIMHGSRGAFELGGGYARRDFVDVRDAVDAYWRLLSHDSFDERVAGRAFNVGSGRSISVSDVIQEITQITGKSYEVQKPQIPKQELVPVQIADISLIHKETGWDPVIPLHQSLKEMIGHREKSINSGPVE